MIHRIEINKTNYLSDITQIITWDPPTPTINGYSEEYIENYQIARAWKFGWVYDNGSESDGAIMSSPTINYNPEHKSWAYSGGGVWQLNIIWKNQAYTFAVVATSLILLLISITLVVRKIKYYKDNQINV